jgi:hypothetical protein
MRFVLAIVTLVLASRSAAASPLTCEAFKIGFERQLPRIEYRLSPYFSRTYEVRNLDKVSVGFDCDEAGRFPNFGMSLSDFDRADLQNWHEIAQAAMAVIAPGMSEPDSLASIESLGEQAFRRAQRTMLGSGRVIGRSDSAVIAGYLVTYELISRAVRMTIVDRRER